MQVLLRIDEGKRLIESGDVDIKSHNSPGFFVFKRGLFQFQAVTERETPGNCNRRFSFERNFSEHGFDGCTD